MSIPIGRILFVDMGSDRWGGVLYMIVNHPIICETCNSVIFDWRSTDIVICPNCENDVLLRDYYPCPKCGEYDYLTMRVVNNNNWYYDSSNERVNEYNDKAGFVINACEKDLIKEIREGKITLYSARQSVDAKRKLLWINQDEYDPTKSIPEWINEQFKYEDQQ